ncbi:MAG: hemolysin family protein [Chitinivibrionales bacterium]|nr:hemolysin family protein [Chitinivibrionales bacterium]
MISERLFLSYAGLAASFLSAAFFASVKLVFSSIAASYIPVRAERLRYFAPRIAALMANKQKFKFTVSFGKLISNTAFSILVFALMQTTFPGLGTTSIAFVSFLLGVAMLGLFGNIIPGAYAQSFYLSYAPAAYIIYLCFNWLFFPVTLGLTVLHAVLLRLFKYDVKLAFLPEREKEMLAKANAAPTSLNQEEQAMVHSIFELKKTTVDEIMMPRINIEGLDYDAALQTTIEMIKEKGHSRIPVYKETIDSIVGILYVKDLIGSIALNDPQAWDLPRLLKKPLFVPLSKKIDDLMREFKRKHLHIAVVVDEYGGTAGIVTMEDILEEIVGEINDEYDVETRPVTKISDTKYFVDPQIDLYDLADALHIHLDVSDARYNTLGGLIYNQVGAIPAVNTHFEFQGLTIKIIAMDNQRIANVEIEILKPGAAATEPEGPF